MVQGAASKMAAGVAMKAGKIFWHGMTPKYNKDGKELVDIILDNTNEIPVNILMVGGRRCGKTTVLSAIFKQAEHLLGVGNLEINAGSLTQNQKLTEKMSKLQDYFRSNEQLFVPDDTPTKDSDQYTFNVSIKNKKGSLALNFIDINGEWFTKSEYEEQVNILVSTSNILLIAIDTPHLMEEKGRFNEGRNFSENINYFIKKNVNFKGDGKSKSKKNCMVLFVPLKCEKYMESGRMDEVKSKIKKAYESSFNHLGGDNADKCVVAITPIITMGGVEFSYFELDSNNEIKIVQSGNNHPIPEESIYRRKDLTQTEPKFRYCEQIILYIIQKGKSMDYKPTKADVLAIIGLIICLIIEMRLDYLMFH